jgi:hypothetical protein
MSKNTTTVIICDHCKREVEDYPSYGGSPLNGWFKVSKINGSTMVDNIQKLKDWDFCSSECLKAYEFDPAPRSLSGMCGVVENYKTLMIDPVKISSKW